MNYIIIDLEFNSMRSGDKGQANSLSKSEKLVNPECPNEIIQIGAVKLDKTLSFIDSFETYIKPVIYKEIDPKVKELTGINEEHLKDGVPFNEGIGLLKGFVDEDSIICSWAKDDVAEIIRNCYYHQFYSLEWIREYIDLQEYCTKVLGMKNSLGLKNALKRFNINFDDEGLHNAINDAMYTAEVLKKIFNARAIKNYIVKDIYTMPSILISNFENFHLDENSVKICCPKCNSNIELEMPFERHKWRFIGVGQCSRCNTKLFEEVTIKKNLKGEQIYSTKGKIISEMEYSEILYKIKK